MLTRSFVLSLILASAVTFASQVNAQTPAAFSVTGPLTAARQSHTSTPTSTLLNNGIVLTAGGYNGSYLSSAELYNPATGTFTTTANLNTARAYHTATLLPGGLVLIVGGYNGSYLSSAELYNSGTGNFTPTGNLNVAREYHSATLLNNGMVLISGGYGSSGYLTSAEVYNPLTGTFTVTGSLNTARQFHTAVMLNNGQVLVAGGYNGSYLAGAELYNPSTGTFTTTTGNLVTARQYHTASVLNTGMVLIAGGAGSTGVLASAELYNPSTGTFAATGSLNTAREYHTASLLGNGLVLIAAGYGTTYLNSAELYNPATGTFAITGSLNTAREYHTATVLSSGQVLVAGGNNGGYLSSAEVYTAAAQIFTITGSMGTARYAHTATQLSNGVVLIAGGYNGSSYFSSAELYNPMTGNFITTGSLNAGRFTHTATLLSNGMVLIAGGKGSSSALSSAELYNPTTGTFALTGSMNVARSNHTATLLNNGMVLIAGGYNGSSAVSSAELYNPTTGAFTLTGSLIAARYYHTGTLLNNGMVLIAGGTNATAYLASAELYNPTTGTFTATGNLNTGREYHTATLLNNGMALIAGGLGSGFIYLTSAELYNPTTGTFALTGSMNVARGNYTATLLNNGMVLVAAGIGSGYLSSAELYNPTIGTFDVTGSLSFARYDHTATLLNNGMVLIAGGKGSSSTLSSSELYQLISSAPLIGSLSSSSGPVGTSVTITGTNFGATQGTNTVTFNGTLATPTSWSNTSIVAPVPTEATTGCVIVTVAGIPSNCVNFSVTFGTALPTITSLSPTSGPVGTSVTIAGMNFGSTQGTSTVGFNGLTAAITSWSATSIVANVPNGATTGNVVVTVAGAASNGQVFNVTGSDPSIGSLSPSVGAVGTCVTISGTNFGATQGTSTVTFNGTAATAVTWSNTGVVACVPAGATTGPIIVTVSGVASNLETFTVTLGNGYEYRRAITISYTQVSNTDQTNFPVLVSGTYAYLATIANGGHVTSANGYDIIFTSDPGGATLLAFEQESYNPLTGNINYWVKLPDVSHTTNTVFYMFYGNPSVIMSQSNKSAVWDSNYLGVWHMSDAAANTTVADSTSNGNNGTAAANTNTKTVSGEIAGALSFNGSTDKVTTRLTRTTAFTWEAWFYQSAQSGYQSIVTIDGTDYVLMDLDGSSGSFWSVDGLAGNSFSITGLATSRWNHLVFARSGDNSSTGYSVYLNGALMGQAASGSLGSGNTITFGFRPDTPSQAWSGNLDEIRVSNTARSANWIATEFNNESSPSTFYSIGSAANGGAGGGSSAPSITSLSPTPAAVGTLVTITGTNFGSVQGTSTVTFNGTLGSSIVSWSATSVVVVVPPGATTGNVVVTVSGLASNGVVLTIPATPSITSLSQTSGAVGTCVTITGTNFGSTQGSSTVTFNGFAATPTSWSANSIGACVPSTATTGNVIVTVGGVASNGIVFTVVLGPIIRSLSPTSGSVGTVITITGSNFGAVQGTSTVTFGGIPAIPASWSNSQIVAPVPNGATSCNLQVVVTVNGIASNNYNLCVPTGPQIGSLSPTSGPVTTSVNIFGSNFGTTQGSSTVTLAGTSMTVVSWSGALIIATVPSGATSGLIVVTVSGLPSNGINFTVTGPPSITSISPTSGPVGSAITITGSNFGATQGSSTVTLAGTAMAVLSWNATGIIAQIPTTATSGNVVVTVGGVASNGVAFTLVQVPGILALSPALGLAGTSVTISGANFGSSQGTSTVTFNGTPANTIQTWNATTIVASVPSGTSTGPVVVTVGGVASNGVTFTVATPPSITSLSPTSGAISTAVTVTGTNFGATQGTSNVTFNGVVASPTSWSITSIGVPVPSGAKSGSVVVTVSGAASNGVNFTVTTPTPSITSLSTTSGSVGTSVTINGTNFGATQGSSLVTFNGIIATPTGWNGTGIVTPVPNGATTGNVVVTVLGLPSNGVAFTVAAAPSITGLSPSLGAAGTPVTITGANFGSAQGTSTVTFHGTTATVPSWGATSIQTSVPSGATTGPVVVTVGGVASNGVGFTVTTLPNITGISPASGPVGTSVAISGINFGSSQGSSTVTFNGIVSTPTSWNSSLIVTPVPNGASSGNVVVTVVDSTGKGMPSNAIGFAVFGSSPTITGIHPLAAAVGTFVTISGSGFGPLQGTSKVIFNRIQANQIGFLNWNDSQIVVQVPGAATTGPVYVKRSDGSVSNGFVFQVITNSGPVGQNAFQELDTYGFDACNSPDVLTMSAGYNYSPFYDTGMYLGGPSFAPGCYTPPYWWPGAVSAQGWGIMPIWVGMQPLTGQGRVRYLTGDNGTASGVADAMAAIDAANLSIPQSIIYADIEQYSGTGTSNCSNGDQTVRNYVGAWVSTLHQYFFLAGVYFSASNWCDMNISGGNAPDAIWVSSGPYYWNPQTQPTNPAYTPNAFTYAYSKIPLYGIGPSYNPLPDSLWPLERIHQFFNGVSTSQTYPGSQFPNPLCGVAPGYPSGSCNPWAVFNGVAINGTSGIDWDAEVAPVVGWQGSSLLPAPNLDGPLGDLLDPSLPVQFDWDPVDAEYYSYHVVISSDMGSLPFPGSGATGCLGICEVDDPDVPSNGGWLDPSLLDPTLTYYWTVSVNGVYKQGDWSDWGSFSFFGCDPYFGCGPQ
jgi:hypothetical protein